MAAPGWGGADKLSSTLEKMLTLQPGCSQAAPGQQPGAAASGTRPKGSQQDSQLAAAPSIWGDGSRGQDAAAAAGSLNSSQLARTLSSGSGGGMFGRSPQDPQARLAKAKSLLSNAALVAKLPDGGARLRSQVATLEQQGQRTQAEDGASGSAQ